MKLWQGIAVAVLLVLLPVLSACDLLGVGDSQAEKERAHYEKVLKAYNEQQEAYRKQQEAYNEQLEQGLNEWSKAYGIWAKQRQQQQIKSAEQQLSDNKS
jgi:hypothetical protein